MLLELVDGVGAGRHDGDHLVLVLPALGELLLARLQTLGNGGHLLDLAVLGSLAGLRHVGG